MRLSILQTTALLCATAIAGQLPCNFPDVSNLVGDVFPTAVESSPNPIGTLYPGNVTGTINGTIAVVPIPYAEARSIIPPKYDILTHQYESILAGFPIGFYPLIVRAILDHDIGLDGVNLVPDFQVSSLSKADEQTANDATSLFTSSTPSWTCSEMATQASSTRQTSSSQPVAPSPKQERQLTEKPSTPPRSSRQTMPMLSPRRARNAERSSSMHIPI